MVAPKKTKQVDEQDEALKQTPTEIPETQPVEEDSDESSSDDEAPEEEGMSQAKSATEQRDRERQKAVEAEQELLREKRRKQNLRFKEQQEQKRIKEMQEFESRLKAQEKIAAESKSDSSDEAIPEELPEDFFEKLEQQESTRIVTKPKHVNFNDIDDNYSQEIKQELQKAKKKTLSKLRKSIVKRGPVKVNLLTKMDNSRSLAPKKNATVTNSKDKWLRRRALGRK